MRNSIDEDWQVKEVKDYINSIKDLSQDELFELYIKNNEQLYHHDKEIYGYWREDYKKIKNGIIEPYMNPDFYDKKNLITVATSDKFYYDEDEVEEIINEIL